MKFSLILFLIGILGFVLNKKNIILMPISIEVMLLSITFLILLSSLSFDDILGQTFSVYIIALISKAVFFLFVSVLPLFYDLFVSSGIIAVSATYIGFKVLGTILLFLTPICLKAIIKPIVNSLDFLPKDFVNFINQKFTFFGLRCTIFSKIWLKQMLIFSSLKSLALCVVIILCTIFHMQFETFIFIYCFSLSVSYTGACSIITKNKNWGFIFCMFIYTFFIICISKYVFFSVLLYIS